MKTVSDVEFKFSFKLNCYFKSLKLRFKQQHCFSFMENFVAFSSWKSNEMEIIWTSDNGSSGDR